MSTREIHVSAITDAVKKLCMEANYDLEPDMLRAFDRALQTERSAAGRQVLRILKDNAQMAKTRKIPYCQDTGVYLGAIGGAGGVLSRFVKKVEIVAYEDLGTEAIRRLEVEDFPAIVVNDAHGGDLYEDGVRAYARP
jgi:tartrate dehydratase beta subunit/fumarate hydratase class I family protein